MPKLSAVELSSKIKSGGTGVSRTVRSLVELFKEKNEALNAYITADTEKSLNEAEMIQRRIDSGEAKSKLAGIPVGVADNLCTAGELTTAASTMLYNFVPPYEATAVRRLREADAVVFGKLNIDEYAMDGAPKSSYYGDAFREIGENATIGVTAAVASGLAPVAIGSDSGGNLRAPAADCGLCALRPSYGAVSRFGLISYTSSMDAVTPVGTSVGDCAAVLEIVSGHDPDDGTSAARSPMSFGSSADVSGLRLGIVTDCFDDGVSKEYRDTLTAAVKGLEPMGATVSETGFSEFKYCLPAYIAIAWSEAGANLARFDGVKYGYRPEAYKNLNDMYYKTRTEGFSFRTRERLAMGSLFLSTGYYEPCYYRAMKLRRVVSDSLNALFEKFDMLVMPVAPDMEKSANAGIFEIERYNRYNMSASLAGLPSLVLPCGTGRGGKPVAFQLVGRAFCEETLVRAGLCYERSAEPGL